MSGSIFDFLMVPHYKISYLDASFGFCRTRYAERRLGGFFIAGYGFRGPRKYWTTKGAKDAKGAKLGLRAV